MHSRSARPTRHRAGFAVALSAAMALGSTAGCSSANPTASAPLDTSKPTTITVWTGEDQGPEKILEGLAAQFHQLHPNVTIAMSRAPRPSMTCCRS